MNKSMTISGTVVLITLILCTRSVALDPDELLAIHHEYVTAMNAHDLDKMMSYWADDGIYDLVSTPPPVPKSYVQSYFEYLFSTFLDFHETEGRTLATNNLVVGENETVRTDPTFGNKLVVSPHLSIYDFEGDKIKQVTTYKDNLSDMVQRGQMDLPEMPKLVPSVEVPDPEPTGLSPMEANTELIARWNSRDAAHVAKMDRADFHIYAGPLGTTLDRAAMMALNEMYFTAFPDVQIEVVRMVDLQDSWVLTELISKGTHKGDFMGVPASGYLTGLRVVWLTRYDADGLVTEQSFYYDNITLLNQMTAPPYLVDGIWITTIPTPMGNLNLTTTYVAQDTERTRYSGSLEEVNPMPLLVEIYPDADPAQDLWAGGQAVMVGRDRYEATYHGYIRKVVESEMGKTVQIVGLVSVNAHFEVIGSDLLYGQGTESCYLASQDADRDGFPDEGEEPVACIPWGWTSKRLTLMPGCAPKP
jgi:steroid delta-isomerase-like uncharacterized protein